MAKFSELTGFVDDAVKNRKYPPNTAFGLKAALRMFESELNEEEKKSIEKVRDNINQISQSVFQKNKSKLSASSLGVYKSRVLKVINDYEKYGTDPAKMANWIVKVVTREKRQKSEKGREESQADTSSEAPGLPQENGYNRINISLNGRKFICVVPTDMTQEEFKKLSAMLG